MDFFQSISVDAAVMDLMIMKGTEKLEMTYRIDKGELVVSQIKKENLLWGIFYM